MRTASATKSTNSSPTGSVASDLLTRELGPHAEPAFYDAIITGTITADCDPQRLHRVAGDGPRSKMLIGAEFEPQPSYSMQSSFNSLASCARKITNCLLFLRDLRVLRQLDRHLDPVDIFRYNDVPA